MGVNYNGASTRKKMRTPETQAALDKCKPFEQATLKGFVSPLDCERLLRYCQSLLKLDRLTRDDRAACERYLRESIGSGETLDPWELDDAMLYLNHPESRRSGTAWRERQAAMRLTACGRRLTVAEANRIAEMRRAYNRKRQ